MRLPNGYGTVYKLSGNRRRPFVAAVPVGFKENGKVDQKPIGYFAKKPEALQALAEYNANKKGQSAVENFADFQKVQKASAYTFTDVYNMWAEQRYINKGKPIPNAYASAFKWCSNLYEIPFKDIKQMHMQTAVDKCEKGYSTKKSIKTLLNQLSKYALGNDIIKTVYSSLVELPTKPKSTKHKPYTDDELRLLWANCGDITAQTILIMSYTGMRPSEFLKIKTENIHLDEGYMRGGIKTAAGINRMIPLADCIMPFIQKMYNPASTFLFPAESGSEMKYDFYYRKMYLPLLQTLNIGEHYPHDGRHTCASALDRAGVNKNIIKMILGHVSNDVTDDVYIHKLLPELIEAANMQPVFK